MVLEAGLETIAMPVDLWVVLSEPGRIQYNGLVQGVDDEESALLLTEARLDFDRGPCSGWRCLFGGLIRVVFTIRGYLRRTRGMLSESAKFRSMKYEDAPESMSAMHGFPRIVIRVSRQGECDGTRSSLLVWQRLHWSSGILVGMDEDGDAGRGDEGRGDVEQRG